MSPRIVEEPPPKAARGRERDPEAKGPPVWIGMCSCGEPTGLIAIWDEAPRPDNPRRGHEDHETRVDKLLSSASDTLPKGALALLVRAAQVQP